MGQGHRHEASGDDGGAVAPDDVAAPPPAAPPARAVPASPASPTSFVASHDILFAPPEGVHCDACGASIETGPADDDDEGFSVPGEGVYLWARGDEVRFERAPLCASCATAIGMTALARWEIEEEEG